MPAGKNSRVVDPTYVALQEIDPSQGDFTNELLTADETSQLLNGIADGCPLFRLVAAPAQGERRRGGAHRQQGLVKATEGAVDAYQSGEFLVIKADELQFVNRRKVEAEDFG